MNTKLYVDHLPVTTTERDVEDLFSSYGNVMSVSIAVNPTTRKARGCGFVTMVTPEGARAAIHGLNGKAYHENALAVSEAQQDKEKRPPRRQVSQLF